MSRVVLILVTAFWLTMNVLLLETEFGSRQNGGKVPVRTVWEKILTAADDSSLTIYQHGKLVGACHLRTAVGEAWSKISDENVPSAPEKNRGYRLRLDGSAVVVELTNRIRFEGELTLDKSRAWQEVNARVTMRPTTWEISSIATEQNVHIKMQGGANSFDLALKFSDLQNPNMLTYQLLGPAAAELANEAGLPSASHSSSPPGLGVKWEAYEDSIRIGHTSVQVYRLHTRLLDRYNVDVIVSRAGEILRVELPNSVLLLNDRLAATEERKNRKPEARKPVEPSAPGASESND